MDIQSKIRSAVLNYFEKDDTLYYAGKKSPNMLFADYSISRSDCPLSTVQLRFIISEDGFDAVFNIRGLKAVEKAKNYTAMLLSYINDGMRYGCFTMTPEDGDVSFVFGCPLPETGELDYEFFDRIVCLGLSMVDRYSDALVPIMLGFSTDPKSACELVESQNN